MTQAETTHLTLLLDESGSMNPNRDAVIAGFNEFIESLRGEDAKVLTSVAMFDTRYTGDGQPDFTRFQREEIPLADITPLTYEDYCPSGGTPLNDAVLATIARMDKHVNGDKAMVVVMTDGHENSSEASTENVRKAIMAKEAAGWAFIYLGANQDVWAEGGARGMGAAGQSVSYTSSPQGTKSAMRGASGMAMNYLGDHGDMPGRAARTYAANAAANPSGVIPEDDPDAGIWTPDKPSIDADNPYANTSDAVKKARKHTSEEKK